MDNDDNLIYHITSKMRQINSQKEQQMQERCDSICELIPEIRKIDSILRTSMIKAARVAFENGDDVLPAIDKIRIENLALQKKREHLLVANGFPFDYLKLKHDCNVCNDTGYKGAKLCGCVKDKVVSLKAQRLSHELNTRSEGFDKFDFSYYSDIPDEKRKISPLTSMRFNYDTCREFVSNFGKKSEHLFLCGSPGLGKTFLSTCIASKVCEKGFMVQYDSVITIMDNYEAYKFGKDIYAKKKIDNYLKCDLLIIDDLGTEMATSFTISALYSIINERLTQSKPMIISTNLVVNDIYNRYNAAIGSRIEGQFICMNFFGEDIRKIKKMRSV